ncbi:unnamed protein product [Angiostrongylus costaricensis]|uniref:Protein arginine N-methyltransferase n=1 Tax=Angiostrongylus costaricensis TaxID=334426 RepID=A0A158PFW8_ANGCS|nr:unnamed protein product [Angiostrongylus costaricensis]
MLGTDSVPSAKGDIKTLCSPEDRQRIHVGWVAGPSDAREEYDHGGSPPPIDLPDVQLQNHLWETYVNAQISLWIDCDSDDEELAAMSEIELWKELNYIAYMGLRSAVIRLKHADSPRLAQVLNQWLWTKNVNLGLWILIPTRFDDFIRLSSDTRDCWTVWANFRKLCSNFYSQKLIAGLQFTVDIDDEFVDKKLLSRWKAEPLATFCVDVDVFVRCRETDQISLPPAHANLLLDLWMPEKGRIMVRGSSEHDTSPSLQRQCAQALRAIVRDVNDRPSGITFSGFLVDSNISYIDVLQVPLQPLADNLDSCVYNTFEQDPVKYKRYREAIESAVHDFGELSSHPEHLVLWRNRCVIIESDMRNIPVIASGKGYPQPDIVVSELLGSFGDNELSPECLDGITPFLKPSTISIPQTYTSYVAPIMSLHIHQQIKMCGASYWNRGISGHGRNGTTLQADGSYRQCYPQGEYIANMDQIYVAYLRQYCALAEPKPLFTFNHPNFTKESNARSGWVSFEIDRPADLMGFAGYFHMNLYKDIALSIVPSTYSEGMISWFPAVVPLRELYRVQNGDTITLNIERKVDDTGVWYEWFIHHTVILLIIYF